MSIRFDETFTVCEIELNKKKSPVSLKHLRIEQSFFPYTCVNLLNVCYIVLDFKQILGLFLFVTLE